MPLPGIETPEENYSSHVNDIGLEAAALNQQRLYNPWLQKDLNALLKIKTTGKLNNAITDLKKANSRLLLTTSTQLKTLFSMAIAIQQREANIETFLQSNDRSKKNNKNLLFKKTTQKRNNWIPSKNNNNNNNNIVHIPAPRPSGLIPKPLTVSVPINSVHNNLNVALLTSAPFEKTPILPPIANAHVQQYIQAKAAKANAAANTDRSRASSSGTIGSDQISRSSSNETISFDSRSRVSSFASTNNTNVTNRSSSESAASTNNTNATRRSSSASTLPGKSKKVFPPVAARFAGGKHNRTKRVSRSSIRRTRLKRRS